MNKNHSVVGCIVKKKDLEKSGKVLARYEQTAGHYDSRYSTLQLDKYKFILKSYQRLEFKDGKHYTQERHKAHLIVDLGCGTGLLVEFLSSQQVFPHSRYLGIDISLAMLEFAKERCDSGSCMPTGYVQGDVTHAPLREGYGNRIFSISVLQNLDPRHLGRFLDEINRISSKNSIIFLSFLHKPPLRHMMSEVESKLKELFPRVHAILMEKSTEDAGFICFKTQ
ncbi:methyltransferase domain-containing protein [Candidatus Bathyarchaeota archaeon]|nr:methyltransferase domain-containing protein [Candidatus Bathyarchaeota archaeon]